MKTEEKSAGSSEIRPLLGVSLLVMLNNPIIFIAQTGMDQYCFFGYAPLAHRPIPLVLTLLLNIFLCLIALTVHTKLWRWQHEGAGRSLSAGQRISLVVGVPILLAFAPSFMLTTTAAKSYFFLVSALMFSWLGLTMGLRERLFTISRTVSYFWFSGALAHIIVLVVLTMSGMFYFYNLEQVAPTRNWFWEWEISFSTLGYPPEEFPQRRREALLLYLFIGTFFMAFFLGGNLLTSILSAGRQSRGGERSLDRRPPVPQSVPDPDQGMGRSHQFENIPEWAASIADQLRDVDRHPGWVAYRLKVSGKEVLLSTAQYGALCGTDGLKRLSQASLVVNKENGTVYRKGAATGSLAEVQFQQGRIPFVILCLLANAPGNEYPNKQITEQVECELRNARRFNVSDAISSLSERMGETYVRRTSSGTSMPGEVKVCFIEKLREPHAAPWNGPV